MPQPTEGVINYFRVWCLANDHDRAQGARAYEQLYWIARRAGEKYNVDARRCCGVFAALSPNNDYDGNVRDMDNLLSTTTSGKELPKLSSYRDGVRKALRILAGEDPERVLHGRKTTAFFRCIWERSLSRSPVIDAHIFSCWLGRRLKVREARITPSQYEAAAKDLLYLSDVLGKPQTEVQGVLWYAWKRLHRIRYERQMRLFPRHHLEDA